MTIGSGSHQYEVVEDWGKLPDGIEYGYTHGVEIDKNDNVIIHNQSKNATITFDRDGNFLSAWGEEFAAGAHGLYLSEENGTEYLYMADNALRAVVKTTLDGTEIYRLGVPDLPHVYDAADKYTPTDTAVAPNGDVYVCDGYGQSWIHVYNSKGEHINSWGGAGSEPGLMSCPHGIWIDTRTDDPIVLVADRGNSRIQRFTLKGEHIDFVNYDLRMPCCFYQWEDEIYIPDLHSRITILDKDNTLITHVGDRPGFWRTEGWPNVPESLWVSGAFSAPHGCAVDSHGDLYVAEWISCGRVTKLRRLG